MGQDTGRLGGQFDSGAFPNAEGLHVVVAGLVRNRVTDLDEAGVVRLRENTCNCHVLRRVRVIIANRFAVRHGDRRRDWEERERGDRVLVQCHCEGHKLAGRAGLDGRLYGTGSDRSTGVGILRIEGMGVG